MKHTVRRDLKEDFVDIWIEIQFNKVRYLTGCVYRTPDESIEGFDYLDNVSRHAKNLEVIVMGDLNCDINETSKQTEAVGIYHGQRTWTIDKRTNARNLDKKYSYWYFNRLYTQVV